jgi:hypothetical protein
LLQLLPLRLELFDLGEQDPKARDPAAPTRYRDPAAATLPERPEHHRSREPSPPESGPRYRHLLADVEGKRLLGANALDAEQVDPNHRSPIRRSAKPTATAAVAEAR